MFLSSKTRWICTLSLAFVLLAAALYLVHAFYTGPQKGHAASEASPMPPFIRIGVVPEGDIFKQRRAYLALKEYLEEKLPRPTGAPRPHVEILTASSYAGVLQDLHERKIDAAFVGSLIAVVAIGEAGGRADQHGRCDADVVLKSERSAREGGRGGSSTYTGVIFVRDDSPVRSFEALARQRLGAVRTTTGGAVFPLYLMTRAAMPPADAPELVWSGTHDDVIREVAEGHLAAGAVKDLRLHNYQREHPEPRLRIIAQGPAVPDNALLFHRAYPADQRDTVLRILRNMHEDPRGAATLAQQNIARYLPCDAAEYDALYDMLETIGSRWSELKIDGPAPRRPYAASASGEEH